MCCCRVSIEKRAEPPRERVRSTPDQGNGSAFESIGIVAGMNCGKEVSEKWRPSCIAVPVSSFTSMSLSQTDAPSSFLMTPNACEESGKALTGFAKLTNSVSSPSRDPSPLIETVTAFCVSRAAKVRVPDTAMSVAPALAPSGASASG